MSCSTVKALSIRQAFCYSFAAFISFNYLNIGGLLSLSPFYMRNSGSERRRSLSKVTWAQRDGARPGLPVCVAQQPRFNPSALGLHHSGICHPFSQPPGLTQQMSPEHLLTMNQGYQSLPLKMLRLNRGDEVYNYHARQKV